MTHHDRLAHLAGYAVIAVVLASATWSGPVGTLIGWLFGLAVTILLAREGYRQVRDRLREEAMAAANGELGELVEEGSA